MHTNGWLQLALFIGVLALITKPLGIYLTKVLDAEGETRLDPLVRPVERLTYRLMGMDPSKEHGWKGYTIAMLLFSAVGMLFTYPTRHRFHTRHRRGVLRVLSVSRHRRRETGVS
jgi:K+-transporting ATPase ATPase A chain